MTDERLLAEIDARWYDILSNGTVYDLYINGAFEGRVCWLAARDENQWARSYGAEYESIHGFSESLTVAQALLLREWGEGLGRTVMVFDALHKQAMDLDAARTELSAAKAEVERLTRERDEYKGLAYERGSTIGGVVTQLGRIEGPHAEAVVEGVRKLRAERDAAQSEAKRLRDAVVLARKEFAEWAIDVCGTPMVAYSLGLRDAMDAAIAAQPAPAAAQGEDKS